MKVVFVTGSNKGIGYGIAEKLASLFGKSNDIHVYITARNKDRGQKAADDLVAKGVNVKFHQLDINDSKSRRAFLNYIKENYSDGIYVAVHNAGVHANVSLPFAEQAKFNLSTNFFDTIKFIEECMPLMATDSRIVVVSSKAGHLALQKLGRELYQRIVSDVSLEELRALMMEFLRHAETGSHIQRGWPANSYEVSKLGLTKACHILGTEVTRDPRNITLNACCPGYVATDLNNFRGKKTIYEGADTPCYLATLPAGVKHPAGQFFTERKVLPLNKDVVIQW